MSVLELINTFEEATGVKVPYRIAPRREGDIEKVWANPTHANEVLGWVADTPLADTMRSAWKWQHLNPPPGQRLTAAAKHTGRRLRKSLRPVM